MLVEWGCFVEKFNVAYKFGANFLCKWSTFAIFIQEEKLHECMHACMQHLNLHSRSTRGYNHKISFLCLTFSDYPSHCVRQNLQDPSKFSCKILQDNGLFLQKNARFLQGISVSCKNLERNFWFNEIFARYVCLEHFYVFIKGILKNQINFKVSRFLLQRCRIYESNSQFRTKRFASVQKTKRSNVG